MGRVGPPRRTGIAVEPRLRCLKRLLGDHGWDGHGKPVLRRRRPMAEAGANGAQRRFACASGDRATLAAVGNARIDGIAENAADAGDIPSQFPHGGGNLCLTEPLGHRIEGAWGVWIGVPGKELCHHCPFDGIEPQAAWVAGIVRV